MPDTKKGEGPRAVEPLRDENAARRDRVTVPGTSGGVSGTSGERGRLALALSRLQPATVYVLVGIGTVLTCLVNAMSVTYDAARFGQTIDLWRPMVWELTSGVMVFALAPLVRFGALAFHRKPLQVGPAALLNVGLFALFFAVHVGGMIAMRMALYRLLGAGPYSFDLSVATLVYEARKDALTYALFAAVFWLAEQVREKREPVEVAPAPSGGLWLKDGATSIRLDPRDILFVASAGNYVEYALAGGKRHLVRGTLQSEETRLKAFGLARIHRQRLVNMRRVTRVAGRSSGDFEIVLDTGDTMVGSRRYRAAVEAKA